MSYTTLPSLKGQVTLPASLREKYSISKETPIIIEDQGNGVIVLKVKRIVDYDTIQFYENEKEMGLHFKQGIDPQVLIDSLKEIDG